MVSETVPNLKLVKAQLSGRKRQPHEKMGDLASDIRHAVGIAHANMAAPYQEDLALDYFIQALVGTDTGAMLMTFRPENLEKAADTAARWEAARLPARGSERHAITVWQVGSVDGREPGDRTGLGTRVELEGMVRDMVDRIWTMAGGSQEDTWWAIGKYPNSERRGVQFETSEACTVPG